MNTFPFFAAEASPIAPLCIHINPVHFHTDTELDFKISEDDMATLKNAGGPDTAAVGAVPVFGEKRRAQVQ